MLDLAEIVNIYNIDYCRFMKGLSNTSIRAYKNDLNQFVNWNNKFDS